MSIFPEDKAGSMLANLPVGRSAELFIPWRHRYVFVYFVVGGFEVAERQSDGDAAFHCCL
jgi:hypothetical protein